MDFGRLRLSVADAAPMTMSNNTARRIRQLIDSSHPSARASHATAAHLMGVPLPPQDGTLHITVPTAAARRRIHGTAFHYGPGEAAWSAGGVRVSAPVDLFVELASSLKLPDLVAAGDHMVQRGWISPADLCAQLASRRGRWVAVARRAATWVRSGSESPMESRVRLLLVLAGLPEPEINPEVIDAHGARRRYDLVYRASRTIVEYDGRQHAEDARQWRSDLQRREAVDEAGWRMIVVTARDLYVTPEETVHRLLRVLHKRGEVGLPRALKAGWRSHFLGAD